MTARQLSGSGSAASANIATATARTTNSAQCAPFQGAAVLGGLIDNQNSVRLWLDWFQNADPGQKTEILTLAARQGLLYSQQIPGLANGQKGTSTNDSQIIPFAKIFRGDIDGLTPVDCASAGKSRESFADAELDLLQREAVARALAAQDIFLLHGYPGTGKSRVLAEILHQAALHGQRVLFLADTPAGIDVVLER